jgi:hypothetical protein
MFKRTESKGQNQINGIFRETHQNHQIFSIVHNCNNA